MDMTLNHKTMTLIYRKKIKLLAVFVFACFLLPLFVGAQSTMSLSVSPTLYEMTANPAQNWDSVIRVINPNPYEMTVYVEPVNFVPDVESGQGSFIKIDEQETQGSTLAEWINFDDESITIAPEETVELPFTISVPEGTGPGGYYGAIFVGTKPPESEEGTSRVETAQVVSALLFLRVSGDITEEGWIRSFRTTERILEKPEATFELRFENTGNVFLQPVGEIEILNMWGQVRGTVPVNRETMFGLVPQESIRKFNFSWKGDWSIADMGRYTAIATLAYGDDSRQFTSSQTTFWVIPWKILLSVLGTLLVFVLFMTWAIKLYVRRMLALAGVAHDGPLQAVPVRAPKTRRNVSLVSPIEVGILDLRTRFRTSSTGKEKIASLWQFVKNYKWFFVAFVVVVTFLYSLVWYATNATKDERSYEVTVSGTDSEMVISSEQLEYESIAPPETEPSAEPATTTDPYPKVKLVNSSGEPGLAAEVRVYLEANAVPIELLSVDFENTQHNTVIVYNTNFVDQAFEISSLLDNALLSSYSGDPVNGIPIVIYLGSDYQDTLE